MVDISLALGGGGVRGIAHIGVIRVLQQAGVRIHAVAGTSAGGLVGILFAADYTPDDIQTILSGVEQRRLFGRRSTDGPSLLGLAGLAELLAELLDNKTFADLALPCAVTATDTFSGQEVILHHGKLIDAAQATAAVPGIFPPVRIGDLLLIDGAVVDPVPVSTAHWLAPELPVVAVALNQAALEVTGQPTLPIPIPGPIPLVERVSRLRLAQAFNIFVRSVEISTLMLTELRLKAEHPDVVIRPDVTHVGILDEIDIAEMVRIGELATQTALPDIMKALGWSKSLVRNVRQKLAPVDPQVGRHDL